jgi:hypothetical protein
MNGLALRQAIAHIHADPAWLRKILLYGLCCLSIFGAPLAIGWVMESIDNSRKGYPTPLPPWFDWTSRYLIGLFTLLIDFTFFVLPLLVQVSPLLALQPPTRARFSSGLRVPLPSGCCL